MSEEDRLELILQYEIAQQILNTFKFSFADKSLYWNMTHQVEKMLLDAIEAQYEVINNDTESE